MILMRMLAGAAALAIFAAPVSADANRRQEADLRWHANSGTGKSGLVDEAEATATLVRTGSGASVRIHTEQLKAGHVYTVWWVLINRPAECASTPCKPVPDILVNNELTESQILFGAGHVVGGNEDGRATFAAHLPVGDIDNGWLGDQGFTNPFGAEIHVVLNDHGPLNSEFMPDMVRTYRGGCTDASLPTVFPPTAFADGEPGPNTCRLYQVADFPGVEP